MTIPQTRSMIVIKTQRFSRSSSKSLNRAAESGSKTNAAVAALPSSISLSECHEADGAISGGTADEIIDELAARERAWLPTWAACCPHSTEFSLKLAKLGEGSEHFVYLTESGENVLKLTKPGIFGDSCFLKDGRVNQRCCTPGDYLLRMNLLKAHFGFAPDAIGVTDTGQIVTLQKFIEGEPPFQEEADAFLIISGLEPVKQSCFIWKRTSPEDGLARLRLRPRESVRQKLDLLTMNSGIQGT